MSLRQTLAAAFTLLLLAAPAFARDEVKITDVRVGLPPGLDPQAQPVSKFAAWAPVFVELEVTGDASEAAEILIEAPDADGVTTTLAVPVNIAGNLAGLKPGTKVRAWEYGSIGYLRPAGGSGEIVVTVRTANGTPLSEPFRLRSLRPREPLAYVVLALGGKPAGFDLPRPTTAGAETPPLRGGRVELAAITEFAQLPDQWFGYEAADLVVLNTGSASNEFLGRLFHLPARPSDKRKQDALLEWVRRGGRVVVSVGANAKLASELAALQPLLPYAIKPDAPGRLVEVSAVQTTAINAALALKGGGTFPMANLVPRPDRPARVLLPVPGRAAAEKEVQAAQSAFGLGRVTVIGFDLDRAPFADFEQRPEFWDWVLRECGAARAPAGDGKPRAVGSVTEDEDEVAVALRQHNDAFDGVPVVSFGWVAVLIVLYILLIGPIEYFFLKRVLGRLELTWITFPVIVLTVSVLAYVSASAVKGRELKVNKVDVVDVDPTSDRVYGTTWLTVFSPRIDTYSVGLTPGDGWGSEQPGTVVEWLGAPRGGRATLMRRRYAIHSYGTRVADGLENVPIQVWSTKAFASNWSAGLNPESGAKRLDSDLAHPPGDRAKVIGSFTHRLPVPALTDCVAFYAGQAYPLPGEVIVSGGRVRLVLDPGMPATQWLQTNGKLESLLTRVQAYVERPGQKAGQRQQVQPLPGGPLPLWGLLFHEAALRRDEGVVPRNASLRRLDQSWRLSAENRDEVIVVGRVSAASGPAEDVLSGPNSPSKLWLKALPGQERPRITGTARQETWVRFYLPVK